MIRSAGTLILSTDRKALFLKRGPGGDAPGLWCIPGGRVEGEESLLDAAVRETAEETGWMPVRRRMVEWTRSISPRLTTGAPPTPPDPAAKTLGIELAAAAQATEQQPVEVPPEEVDFTTFAIEGVEEFIPDIAKSGEHVAYAWAPIDQPPQPMHPGAQVALDRFGMDELGVACAIRDGRLTSPQQYGHLWLFAMRITGTGVAYRSRKMDGKKVIAEAEYAWRDPAIYLNDRFLQRCNGLPVVLVHPKGNMLDTEAFNETAIGAVMLPYIKGDEVWAIARIQDEDAAKAMVASPMSTSPGVVWRDGSVNAESEVDGHKFLIEGVPSLMDHVAVCWQGVWDKGGKPSGVQVARKDSQMATPEELEAQRKREEAMDKSIAALQEGMTALSTTLQRIVARHDEDDKKEEEARKDAARSRADNFKFSRRDEDEDDDKYKAKHDAEEKALCDAFEEAGEAKETAADKAKRARKDAEDEESEAAKEKAAKDAADRADRAASTTVKALQDRIDDLTKRLDHRHTDADVAAFGRIQHRFDAVYTAKGGKAPGPLAGESVLAYTKRLALECKSDSPRWKDAELTVVAADETAFSVAVDQIIEDALKAARDPAKIRFGTLRPIAVRKDSGHNETTYEGEPLSWMRSFMPPGQVGYFTNISNNPSTTVKG